MPPPHVPVTASILRTIDKGREAVARLPVTACSFTKVSYKPAFRSNDALHAGRQSSLVGAALTRVGKSAPAPFGTRRGGYRAGAALVVKFPAETGCFASWVLSSAMLACLSYGPPVGAVIADPGLMAKPLRPLCSQYYMKIMLIQEYYQYTSSISCLLLLDFM